MVTTDPVRGHASWWAAAAWVVTGVAAGLLVWTAVAGPELPHGMSGQVLSALTTAVAYGAASAVLVDRRPDLPFGWLLGVTAMTQVVAATASVAAVHAWQGGDTGLGVRVGAATTSLLFLPIAMQGLVNVRFPSGRPSSRAGRHLELAIVVGTSIAVVGGAVVASSAASRPAASSGADLFDNIAGSGLARIGSALQALVPVVILLGLVAGIGVVVRYRGAQGIERQQLEWRAAGVIVALALFPLAVVEILPNWLDAVDAPLFVLTLAIPVLRYRLWSIDTIVRRSVVYGFVTLALVASYLALTAAGTALMSERVGASVAAVAVALAFAPLRTRVQRLVDQLAYGNRRDPDRTIRDLDRRLGEIAAPGEVLPAIVETVGRSLRLPFVAIERIDGTSLVAHGRRSGPVERWPLVHDGAQQGFLVASPRRGEDEFDARDRELLADVARHAGVAVHAEVLTKDLIASRQHLVTMREEERRRLRRDLHDGLGPTLTGIGLSLDAARAQVHADPECAEQLIKDAKVATSEALDDVRRLVYGLRPPALDNLGLVGAIRRHTDQLSSGGCRVVVDANSIPELPAAVEVAAYRAVVEAVTNSIRHGRARRCTVSLNVAADALEIGVDDDGTSIGEWTPGVGLLSMMEQAVELGGTVDAGPIHGGGARVSARYPIPAVSA